MTARSGGETTLLGAVARWTNVKWPNVPSAVRIAVPRLKTQR
jgi:hypothetical protein